MKSWKIGAVAGLIAGIVAGLVFTIFAKIAVFVGFISSFFHPIVPNAYGINVSLNVLFGVICGVIFSRAYNVIPGKRVAKGLFYGLILTFLIWVQAGTFNLAYGLYLDAVGFPFIGFFTWVIYGLVLGFLYESLHEEYNIPKVEKRIIQYDIKGGILPGAIAGIADGIAAALTNAIASMTGLFGPQVMTGAPDIFTLDFWVYQSGAHIFLNMIWGVIIGMMFTQVYNLVPGRGIIKGLCYSLIIFVIYVLYVYVPLIGWGFVPLGLWTIFVGLFSTGIALGLVLGYLYKPPK